MLKNRIKFTALTLVFAFLLSSCSTKKTGQEWNSYNENSEWSYFMPNEAVSSKGTRNCVAKRKYE